MIFMQENKIFAERFLERRVDYIASLIPFIIQNERTYKINFRTFKKYAGCYFSGFETMELLRILERRSLVKFSIRFVEFQNNLKL